MQAFQEEFIILNRRIDRELLAHSSSPGEKLQTGADVAEAIETFMGLLCCNKQVNYYHPLFLLLIVHIVKTKQNWYALPHRLLVVHRTTILKREASLLVFQICQHSKSSLPLLSL